MKNKRNILSDFPTYLFWDLNIHSLDPERDQDIIIPRALYMTSKDSFEDDIVRLENLYTSNQIVKELKNTKEKISNEVCELVARRYSVQTFHRF